MTNYSNVKKNFNLQLKSFNPQGTVATRKVWLPPTKYGCHPQSTDAICKVWLPPAKYNLPPAKYNLPPAKYNLPPAKCNLPPAKYPCQTVVFSRD